MADWNLTQSAACSQRLTALEIARVLADALAIRYTVPSPRLSPSARRGSNLQAINHHVRAPDVLSLDFRVPQVRSDPFDGQARLRRCVDTGTKDKVEHRAEVLKYYCYDFPPVVCSHTFPAEISEKENTDDA